MERALLDVSSMRVLVFAFVIVAIRTAVAQPTLEASGRVGWTFDYATDEPRSTSPFIEAEGEVRWRPVGIALAVSVATYDDVSSNAPARPEGRVGTLEAMARVRFRSGDLPGWFVGPGIGAWACLASTCAAIPLLELHAGYTFARRRFAPQLIATAAGFAIPLVGAFGTARIAIGVRF